MFKSGDNSQIVNISEFYTPKEIKIGEKKPAADGLIYLDSKAIRLR